jgi:hypothetical protein
MTQEFEYIVEDALNFNRNNILNEKEIKFLKKNLTYFIKDKESLLCNMNKLANIDEIAIDKIIATKRYSEFNSINLVFTNIHLAILEYSERFYTMKEFLRKLLYYYKKKAKMLNCNATSRSFSELAVYHQAKHYVSGIPELEQLMEIIEKHNNYLGKNRILSDRLIVQGYKRVAELSALSCEIQAILYALNNTAYDDFCTLDFLLRLLTEKIGLCFAHLDWVNDNITRGMLHYPDGL